jgi:hypothetical protein
MSEAIANKLIEINANKEKIKAHLRATMPAFDPTMTNAQFAAMWPIDVKQDPYSVPLESIDVGHPALFEADAMWPYFERMRKEAPVHYCAKSQFGPYWSLTKFADIMHTDTNHQVSRPIRRSAGSVSAAGPIPTRSSTCRCSSRKIRRSTRTSARSSRRCSRRAT